MLSVHPIVIKETSLFSAVPLIFQTKKYFCINEKPCSPINFGPERDAAAKNASCLVVNVPQWAIHQCMMEESFTDMNQCMARLRARHRIQQRRDSPRC